MDEYQDDLPISNNNNLYEDRNELSKTLIDGVLTYNSFINNSYKLTKKLKLNKHKKIFKNKILKINIDKMPNQNEYHKFNEFSLVVQNTLYEEFKMLPNIKRFQNLTNENLIKLTGNHADNSFIIHKQKNNNHINLFKYYINNVANKKKNKPIKIQRALFSNYSKTKSNKTFNNIRQYILNSNYLDLNYKIDLHKSWCSLFNKNKTLNISKNKIKKKEIDNKNKKTFQKTLTTDESIKNNKKQAKKNKISSKSIILNEKKHINNSFNKKINDTNLNQGKVKKKFSAIDRFLFKLQHKDECYEDYISDGKPTDKYIHFKRLMEKNQKNIEKQLLELRRLARKNIN